MFDDKINNITHTYEENKTVLTELLDEIYARAREEVPLTDQDSSIIETGRPVDPNLTVIESPIIPIITGANLTSTPEDRTRPQQTIIKNLYTERHFGENTDRGDVTIRANNPRPNEYTGSDQRQTIETEESAPTLQDVLKHHGMDARVARTHPNYQQLIALQQQVCELYQKGLQIQQCKQRLSREEVEAHRILEENMEDLGERIETLAQEWGAAYTVERTLNAPKSFSKPAEQQRIISSTTNRTDTRTEDNRRRETTNPSINTNVRDIHMAWDVPRTTQNPRQQASLFTPDLMMQMGATIATAIADSIRPLSERTADQTQTLPRAKPVLQKIELFKGELEEGLDWLEDFEVVAANNGWDNEQKAKSADLHFKAQPRIGLKAYGQMTRQLGLSSL